MKEKSRKNIMSPTIEDDLEMRDLISILNDKLKISNSDILAIVKIDENKEEDWLIVNGTDETLSELSEKMADDASISEPIRIYDAYVDITEDDILSLIDNTSQILIAGKHMI